MIIFILFVLGLCLGSFANALVWRVREQEQIDSRKGLKSKSKKQVLTKKDLSILKGRSMCPKCHHTLAAKDLVPVLSWLSLKGRCRYCKTKIAWQYPLVELATAGIFVFSCFYWPLAGEPAGVFSFIVWLVALVGLMALLVYDIRWQLLPNRIVYPMLIGAVAATGLQAALYSGGVELIREAALAGVIGGGIFYALFMISDGKWIGGGDVKLGALLGILVADPVHAFLILFLASLLGTVFILPGLALKKITSKTHIPFGPFLIIAAIIVKLFAASFVAWYERTLLIM